ncbi:head-tail connector protein [uncultured Endozoicomonas sp.]|uniref:head-tail connector protein n=1 Tax=uncultured Endozoicomonas sp. TaxID=432652 RepID=UPI002633206A|nr:head-tail connector protein [uncultured Endozoicomonas sp.]
MQFLTTDQIKQQCRLDLDDSTDDAYLELIGEASEQAVEAHLNRKLYADAVPDEDSNGLVINNPVRMAMLLMVGQLYENREATSELTMKEVPLAYSYLLESYRIIPV